MYLISRHFHKKDKNNTVFYTFKHIGYCKDKTKSYFICQKLNDNNKYKGQCYEFDDIKNFHNYENIKLEDLINYDEVKDIVQNK